MTFLDLCAGIGGFSLGLEWAGMICKGQVEIDEFCNRILAKHWPDVPRWGDIKTLDPACLPAVDLIAGGYPCQPFSYAGHRKGADDDRHLWPFIRKILAHLGPAWCLFENVVGHTTLGLDQVLSDLESEGYAAWPLVIPACAVDADHRRNRVWILAYLDGKRIQGGREEQILGKSCLPIGQVGKPFQEAERRFHTYQSRLCRSLHGVPHGVDRIISLGNAVVPQLVQEIGIAIIAAHNGI